MGIDLNLSGREKKAPYLHLWKDGKRTFLKQLLVAEFLLGFWELLEINFLTLQQNKIKFKKKAQYATFFKKKALSILYVQWSG